MTLEDRLNEIETAIQTLRRDMQKSRKFKVGDEVVIFAVINKVDENDTELPYYLDVEGMDGGWFAESYLHHKAP